jgi:CelD/BcsL family acetyltransferase involved in cellulose biosynthesis
VLTGSLPEASRWRAEAAATPVCCEVVSSLAALERLTPEWESLWRRARASPFQSPAWLLPWWKHVGRGVLASAALRCAEDGELVGFAPLYVYTDPQSNTRHLFPLGIATTDRLDMPVAPGWQARVGRALVDHLVDRADEWDLLEAPQLPAGSALGALAWPARWRGEMSAGDPNPVLALPAAVPASMARNLAYCRRRVQREGSVTYESADAKSLPELLDALDRLHARRWAGREQPGVLRGEGVLDWHREAAPLLLERGLLRLIALRIDGRVLAVLHGLADPPWVARRRWSYYIGGFDPEAASLSPGTLLVGHAIEQAQAEGAALFDFLRGTEPYKQRWGAEPEAMWTLRVGRE